MKKLKKTGVGFNSVEEIYRNCTCYHVNCACNPTIYNANMIIYESRNNRVTQRSVHETSPYGNN